MLCGVSKTNALVVASYDSLVAAQAGASGADNPTNQGWTYLNGSNSWADAFDSTNGGWRIIDATSSTYEYYSKALNSTQRNAMAAGWVATWTVSMDSDAINSSSGFVDNYFVTNYSYQNNQAVWIEDCTNNYRYILYHKVTSGGNLIINDGTRDIQVTSDVSAYDNFKQLKLVYSNGSAKLYYGTSYWTIAKNGTPSSSRVIFGAISSSGQGSLIWNNVSVETFSMAYDLAPSMTTVYSSGTGGYYCYRIPAIVRTNSGALLAFAEGRTGSCADGGNSDILVKRSTNNGWAWDTAVEVDSYGTNTLHNPVPVVDADDGTVHLLYGVNLNTIYYKYNTNDGVGSWSSYTDLGSVLPAEIEGGLFPGPAHGIQLLRGDNAGRLVAPYVYQTLYNRKIRLLYSDNGGSSWSSSAGRIMSETGIGVNEVTIAELTNGNIYFNMRNQFADESSEYYRIVAQSSDCLANNATPSLDTELPDPKRAGAVLRVYATDQGDDYDHMIFSNLATQVATNFLTIRSSFDETNNWTKNKLLVYAANGCAYSDMVNMENGQVGILYETDESTYAGDIKFVRLDIGWLTDPVVAVWEFEDESIGNYASAGETLDNSASYALGGTVTGCMTYVAGPGNETALRFGGTSGSDTSTTDYITISDGAANNTLDFSTTETFFVKASIKTTSHGSGGGASSGAIISKDSVSSKSWYLRVENGYAKFVISDSANSPGVTSSVQVNDGNWHTIYAGRDVDQDKLLIYVDGILRGSATDTTTSTLTSGENIRIGNFNHYSRQFIGDIDYVAIYNFE